MDDNSFDQILKAHLGAVPFECRWCFAIDGERVGGEEIENYCFRDLQVIHLRCPRCGGEFTYASEGFEASYLKERICKVYPELSAFVSKGFPRSWPKEDMRGLYYKIVDIRCIDGTEEGKIVDCLFPELSTDSPERRRLLDLLFQEYRGPGKPK